MGLVLHFNNKISDIGKGSCLFDYADSLQLHIPASCSRQGKCRECIVEIEEGIDLLSEPTPEEAHLTGNYRLACMSRIIADKGLIRCSTLHRGKMKILSKPSALKSSIDKNIIDPTINRCGKKVFMDGEEIDDCEGPVFGTAIDIGTTTVNLRLLNLETGVLAAESSFENPQRFGGTDVMSRIVYDHMHKGKLLQKTLAGYISHAIEEFPVSFENIYEIVISGNSVMRDLFFGLDVYSLGQNPYKSITEFDGVKPTSITGDASELQISANRKARIYGLPLISGNVGADAAACMLAADIFNEERLIAIMDIGTNTEIILGNKNKIIAASCPAGPAFEGRNISCGMPGLTGAIERVSTGENDSFSFDVIDNITPSGICGSGLIDLLGELTRKGWIDSSGRFTDEARGSHFNTDYNRVEICNDGNNSIYINERDVNELAQAKGANAAGLKILFKNFGVEFNDIDIFYIAGGFGNYIDIESAIRIGLIPDIARDKINYMGNASLEGASIALLSRSKRNELEDNIRKVKHCRLETDPDFFSYFADACQFKPLNKDE